MREIDDVQIIEKTYNLICNAKELKTEEDILKFIGNEKSSNFNILLEFYNDMYSIEPKYLYRNFKDRNQSDLSLKFQEICKWIISNKYIFEETEYYDFIPDNLIYSLMNKEENHVFSLMDKKNSIDFYSELEHQHFRNEIENIIRNKDESKRTHNESCFLNDREKYYKNFFSHSMNLLEKNFFEIPSELIDDFLKELDNHNFLDEILYSNNTKKMNFKDSNLVYQYSRFVLKMKSIFQKDKLYNDKLIRGIYDGKITNPEIIKLVFSNQNVKDIEKKENKRIGIPFDYEIIFRELLKKDGKDTSNIYSNLAQHFKSVNMSDLNINQILREIIRNDNDEENALNFLSYLGIRENTNFDDFLKSGKLNEHRYLAYNYNLFDILKEAETNVMNGKVIPIPYDYAIDNIELFSKEAYDNIQTLVENGYYSEEQTKNLKNELIRLNRYHKKSEISYEEAIVKLSENINNGIKISEYDLKDCLNVIIQNKLKEKGIDIGKNVYFGEDESTLGTNLQSEEFKTIWINNKLVRNYIKYSSKKSDKYDLFVTMFHEIQHSIQFDNIEKGKIDYLTYNFIKEEIIRKHDKVFYESNYRKMFIEEDARQNGIIEAMKFLKEININNFEKIYSSKYKDKLSKELNFSNILQDSKKNIPFRSVSKTSINDYLEKLLHINPELLEHYGGILKIEFNQDGSQRDLRQILDEFNNIEDENEKDAKFSIYYGIIDRKQFEIGEKNISPELNEKIKEFSERKTRLVSPSDLRYYFKRSEPILNKVMLDVITKEINNSNKLKEEKVIAESEIQEKIKVINKENGVNDNERY